MVLLEYIVPVLAILSAIVAVISLILGVRSVRQLQQTERLVESISALVNASQDLGVTMVYSSRNAAFERFWSSHVRSESSEVVILGTSLLGLMTGCPDANTIIQSNPKKFKFVLVHPDFAEQIQRQEDRDTIRVDILNALRNLTRWGVPEENIRLLKGSARNFVIFTSTRALINPTVYETDAFRYFCIECEKKHSGDVYHQYYEHHYKTVWNGKLTVEYRVSDWFPDKCLEDGSSITSHNSG